ncbi:major allergen Pru ar 1 [Ricinus communis]|uniref:Major allergen Pru ar, putative n=1 Tax=Ricinus communis TaxID=3988 RepID=B9RZK0_RICCO|nr:major allergen Pru ar 1 [Ricinus communis]EEF43033.1 Major allergen Pru ar, putative [Ricinus communis]|eukprot:XP_002519169.1 major allergen Pru ar 1 [Ricinus communis]
MGLVSCEIEIDTSLPAAKMFQAVVLEGNTLVPKILPQAIQNVEVLEGDGGPGTIKQINFSGGESKYVKERVDAVDKDNLTYAYTMIEGDFTAGNIEKISNELKFEDTAAGGSLLKYLTRYHTIGDFELKQEDIQARKEMTMGMFKAVEAYLLANPNAL